MLQWEIQSRTKRRYPDFLLSRTSDNYTIPVKNTIPVTKLSVQEIIIMFQQFLNVSKINNYGKNNTIGHLIVILTSD